MLGERDWKELIDKMIKDKYNKITKIDDINIISVGECIRCLRRSYYDRKEPLPSRKEKIKRILDLRSEKKEYEIDGIKLVGYAYAIMDGVLFDIIYVNDLPKEPFPEDILSLNANLFIFEVEYGIIIYVNREGDTIEFTLGRDKKIFNELIRRVKIFNTLLRDGKTPVIEPSSSCIECQYNTRCYIRKWEQDDSFIARLLGRKES